MTIKLFSGAESCLNTMQLSTEKEKVVTSCVIKYAKPDKFSEKIKWVVFRIVQAVKSLFGKSLWQKTELIIVDHFIQTAIDKNIIQLSPENPVEKEIKKQAVGLFLMTSKKLFALTFSMQKKKTELTTQLQSQLNDLSLEFTLNKIDSIKKEIYGIAS